MKTIIIHNTEKPTVISHEVFCERFSEHLAKIDDAAPKLRAFQLLAFLNSYEV